MTYQFVVPNGENKTLAFGQLHYIFEMLGELQTMAPAEAGPLLPYLIGMAQLETIEAADALTRGRRKKADADGANAA